MQPHQNVCMWLGAVRFVGMPRRGLSGFASFVLPGPLLTMPEDFSNLAAVTKVLEESDLLACARC